MNYYQFDNVLEINYINLSNRFCRITNVINSKYIPHNYLIDFTSNRFNDSKIIYKDDIWNGNSYRLEYEKYVSNINDIKYLIDVKILNCANNIQIN